jgi:Integral membrane protein (PIN domain superfamily)
LSIRNFKQLFSVVFAVILGGMGFALAVNIPNYPDVPILQNIKSLARDYDVYRQAVTGAFSVLGILIAFIVGPKLAESIIRLGNAIERMSTRDKIAVGVGTFVGVAVSLPFWLLMLRVPIAGIPLSVLFSIAFIYLGIRGTMGMKNEFRFIAGPDIPVGPDGAEISMDHAKILDTNVIIDGRIKDVCATGFLEGPIYVPGFVLDELQHIADSSDSLKRARGRRGLDILNQMQKEFPLVVRSYDHKSGSDGAGEEVDARLVKLAKAMSGLIVTNDFNLNKVAALQGVAVLNVNELANALKPVVLPGEEMPVTVIKEGKESGQGVAYLDDGTMIVIEDGRRHISETVSVIVTSVLQTVAGKMIFARVKGSANNGDQEDHDSGDGPRFGGGRPRFKIR